MEIILIIVALFILLSQGSGGLSSLFGSGNTTGQSGAVNIPPTGFTIPPQAGATQGAAPSLAIAGAAVGLATGIATSAAKSASDDGTGNALSQSIPVIGAAVAILISIFAAQSAKRAKEAGSENAAVASGVPGWDQAVAQVVNAYNTGQITSAQVGQLLNQIMSNYWQEVGPLIQPGRNGCSNGKQCPGSAIANSSTSLATTAPKTYCSGNIGAACCVGCANLQLGVDNMLWAVSQADNTGKPTPASIPQVFPSKYGGISRPGYTVTFIRYGFPQATGVPVQLGSNVTQGPTVASVTASPVRGTIARPVITNPRVSV